MSETRKLAAILAADVVGFSRLTGADEERTLARLRALRSDLIDPTIAVHHGRVVKRTGDGALVEFRSVVDAVRCAIEVQNVMVERNAGVPEDRRIVFRIGIHLGDVVEEADGDLMGDGVNIAARLEGVAKPGAICLSEDAYRQVRQRLDLRVSDLGATALKNIAEPIRVYSLEVGAPGEPKPGAAAPDAQARSPPSRKPRVWALSVAAIVVLLVGGTAGWYVYQRRLEPPPAAHLSIVVLPFNNLSGDPAQDYFADGVTDMVTTDLSRIRDSFVIARNTAFTFKGKNVDVKEIGKELGVRYVLEGSVQRDQGRVRVNAQLIDAETGANLWADRFEEDISDVFKLQDEVVAKLANALRYELVNAEAAKSASSQNPDAIDFVMRGAALFSESHTQNSAQEHALFQQALKLDPNNSLALAWDATIYWGEYAQGARDRSKDYDEKIIGQTDKAIAADPSRIEAYLVKAGYLAITGRQAEALRVADQGLAIDPNAGPLHAVRSIAETRSRQFQEAKADIEQAMRLSPRDPQMSWWRNLAADAELGLGHLDAAIDLSRKSIEGGYRSWFSYLNLAAASALNGDLDDAKSALAEARKLNPKLSIKFLSENKPILQPAFDALRKAGLPEE